MATILDTGLLKHFSGLFPFLLVLILTYAFLSNTVFKERKATAALVSFVLALLTLTSDIAIKTINLMSPWFVLLLIFGIFLIIAFMSFGVKEEDIKGVITGGRSSTFFWWVLGLMLIIMLGSLLSVVEEEAGLSQFTGGGANITADGTAVAGEEGFWQTLLHPKILGMAVVLLVAYFTISNLTEKSK